GSSATLGTDTSFVGDIMALTSITLTTGADILCGAALARNGAVTLDTNNITSYDAALCAITAITAGSVLDSTATEQERAVAAAIDAFVAGGGILPLGFQVLANTLTPAELAAALAQLAGETATGVAPAATGSMDSFLSVVTGGDFGAGPGTTVVRVPAPSSPAPKAPASPAPGRGTVKALGYADENEWSSGGADFAWPAAPGGSADPGRASMWGAVYGNLSLASGSATVGTHDLSASAFGVAIGIDRRVMPDFRIGIAVGGGGTSFDLADGFGSGRSAVVQTALYARKNFDAAYVSAALAYAWNDVSTDRTVTVGGTERYTAGFSAHDFAGDVETGYRFGWFTPYAAARLQALYTPAYSEDTASGSPLFALDYAAHTTTEVRTELGIRFDRAFPLPNGMSFSVGTRAAWVHDYWSSRNVVAGFQALPGSSFVVTGAAPAADSFLFSAGAQVSAMNGLSLAGSFDGRFANNAQTYGGTLKLRKTW
ncbi:MAG TPA: autotransporter domain-containing protein, partial [Bauldia sp.]|nr:autotransporter domain-containing protein [Bauldia sp.]